MGHLKYLALWRLAICAPGLVLVVPAPSRTQGYSVETGRVVVNTASHWEDWTYPEGVVDITDGVVKPFFIRKSIDAVADAAPFGGGIRAAGSNLRQAARILDPELGRFWEPDKEAPLEDWWVEVDLGRLVVVTRIVVRFVEEGTGDPFNRFAVLSSTGMEVSSGVLQFDPVGKVLAGGQRVFEFELSPEPDPMGWTGEPIRFVRLDVTDSRRGRAEQITQAQYEALAANDRGDIQYHVRSLAGIETRASHEIYESVPAERQGSLHYFRRERPRLAHVEVWALGDNISLGWEQRHGRVDVDFRGGNNPTHLFDGDFETGWRSKAWVGFPDRSRLEVDLGAHFWVDTFRLLLRSPLLGYRLQGSDGSTAPDATLIWQDLSPDSRAILNNTAKRYEEAFAPSKLRYLAFQTLNAARFNDDFRLVREIQLFGEGYLPEVTLTSEPIELKQAGERTARARNLTSIEWNAVTQPGTDVVIRTQTGNGLTRQITYYNTKGEPVSKDEYDEIPSFRLKDTRIDTSFVEDATWSNWSERYIQPGERIKSPSPRKFLKIETTLLTDDPEHFPALAEITVNFRDALVQGLVGEIWPDRDVEPLMPHEFELFIAPQFVGREEGFDQILVESPPGIAMELLDLSIGDEADSLTTASEFSPTDSGNFSDDGGRVLDVLRSRGDSLWIALPEVLATRAQAGLVRLRFTASVFFHGTTFDVSVSNSTAPGEWQGVDAGDATSLRPGQTLAVSIPLEDRSLIGDVTIRPNLFTPNGDGINDEALIGFSVLRLNVSKTVEVEIYTLAGNLVREYSLQRAITSGRYDEIRWAGDDLSGSLVPPGIYLARIHVDTDADDGPDATAHRLIHVVY